MTVYSVRITTALATIPTVEKWILPFGIPQSIIHNRGTAFINTEFINWTKELGNTLRPRTAHFTQTKGKIETQDQYIIRYWRNFLNDAGNNWSSLAPKFAFAHNTSVNYTTGKTPYEFVFGTKPLIPMSLKLRLYRNKHKFCCSNFCKDLPSHSHSQNSLKNEFLDNLLQPHLLQALLEKERTFKHIYSFTFERCREKRIRPHDHTLIAIASNWDTTSKWDRKYFTKITNKNSYGATNFNSEDLDPLPIPSVSLTPLIKYKMIKPHDYQNCSQE